MPTRTRTTRTHSKLPPTPRVRIFRGTDGQFYWHHVARNGRIIADSEGYVRAWNAARGARRAVPGCQITYI